MASKDQAIGGLIFIICAVIAIAYVITLFYPQWLGILGFWETIDTQFIQFWLVAIPVFIAFIVVLAIGAWIGWTMATTPPPKPIEEIEAELETGAEEETEKEKK